MECLTPNVSPLRNNGLLKRDMGEVEKIIREQIKSTKPFLTYDPNSSNPEEINLPRRKFNFDKDRLHFHKERVEALKRGERVAPITIDMALTQRCQMGCVFCYADLQQNPSTPLPWEIYKNFLDDCVQIGHKPGEGVKGISLVSDGESTLSDHYLAFVKRAKENGIDIAAGTNGFGLRMEDIPELVQRLTYIRFNISGADPQSYSRIMGSSPKAFSKVIENIKECVQQKKKHGSNVTIGLQQVLLKQYADQVIPLALLGRELGVDYTLVKHCSDDEKGSLGVDYAWYRTELAQELLRNAEALSTEDYSVQAKWSKMKAGRDRSYTKCFGTPLLLQMSGSGLIAPCGSFFNPTYEKYHIGHLKDKRFKDIWASERYWQVMDHLKSESFDPRTQCETLCHQDKPNETLFNYFVRGIPLQDSTGMARPRHVNFVTN